MGSLWVGDKGLDVFEGFTFAKPEDAAKLNVALKKFEEYCAPRKNHIMAALKFNDVREIMRALTRLLQT